LEHLAHVQGEAAHGRRHTGQAELPRSRPAAAVICMRRAALTRTCTAGGRACSKHRQAAGLVRSIRAAVERGATARVRPPPPHLCTAGFQWCRALCSKAPITRGRTVSRCCSGSRGAAKSEHV
jgi:hypothetical protein